MTVVAASALEGLTPAWIGVGRLADFDPTDAVYADRRPYNDVLGPRGELIIGNGGEHVGHVEPIGRSKDRALFVVARRWPETAYNLEFIERL